MVRSFEPLNEILKHKHTDALFWISVYLKLLYTILLCIAFNDLNGLNET